MSKATKQQKLWGTGCEQGSIWATADAETKKRIQRAKDKHDEERRLMEGWYSVGCGASHYAHEIPLSKIRGEGE